MAIHALPESELAVLGDEARLIVLANKIVQVVVAFEDDVPAAPAVAAAGAALGTILLALESDAPLAAVAGPGVNPDFVNEHKKRRGACLAVKSCPGRSTGSRGHFRQHIDPAAALVESNLAGRQGE